ncbi:SPX domain-containing protein [Melanogaster broomeanus]|nr:SPX domain-containing protein [Melanogaster broomeanus]
MHFSKTYAQLLLSLPPELRDNAIQYRQLKKLINQVVTELNTLGLSPSVLQQLLEHGETIVGPASLRELGGSLDCVTSEGRESTLQPTIVYEIASKSTYLEPRLRLSLKYPYDADIPDISSTKQPDLGADSEIPDKVLGSILHALQLRSDLIIPLRSDTAFFQLLTSTLFTLSEHFHNIHENFNSTLAGLANAIASTARPASSSAPRSFSVYSLAASNAATLRPSSGGKSDLYTWREVFQLYIDAEVFESVGESNREAEKQLRLFEGRIEEKKASLKLAGSKEALEVFLRLNLFILDVKKFQFANAEAARKILKKHTKRTALPIPSHLLSKWNGPILTPSSIGLPSILDLTLLPVVPHIDDYSCPICTNLACGHLFCCLVKLQKRGKANCPMCRAPTVLQADRTNVDYALLNFMSDWFPLESQEKLHANEREAAREQLEEFGFSGSSGCLIM